MKKSELQELAAELNSIKDKLHWAGPGYSSYGGDAEWSIGAVVDSIERLTKVIAKLAGLETVKKNENTIIEHDEFVAPKEAL